MAFLRRIARPLLASAFIGGGCRTLRQPSSVAPAAEPVARPVAARVPALPTDPEQLVRINSAVQVGAGVLFATGRFPRVSALALAASLVPTTLAGHPYWKIEDPDERAEQRIHFYKNVSLLGGLLLAAADTHGKPSLAYRSRRGVAVGRARSRRGMAAGRTRARLVRRDAQIAGLSARIAVGRSAGGFRFSGSRSAGFKSSSFKPSTRTARKRLPVS